jgi:glutamate formiminotransferase
VNILAGMRVVYGGNSSFDELMAYPTAQLATEYWFPFYNHNNVNLDTEKLEIAQRIAKTIRTSSGGLSHVKAMGVPLTDSCTVQVSMNLIDYQHTGISQAFEAVRKAAAQRQVEVLGAEIVGLVPRAALDREAAYFRYLENFRETLVIETLLEQAPGKR